MRAPRLQAGHELYQVIRFPPSGPLGEVYHLTSDLEDAHFVRDTLRAARPEDFWVVRRLIAEGDI